MIFVTISAISSFFTIFSVDFFISSKSFSIHTEWSELSDMHVRGRLFGLYMSFAFVLHTLVSKTVSLVWSNFSVELRNFPTVAFDTKLVIWGCDILCNIRIHLCVHLCLRFILLLFCQVFEHIFIYVVFYCLFSIVIIFCYRLIFSIFNMHTSTLVQLIYNPLVFKSQLYIYLYWNLHKNTGQFQIRLVIVAIFFL